MVLTIGNDDDGLAYLVVLAEAVLRHLNGSGNICALCANHRGVDAAEEHLGRHIVAGHGQLYKGIAGKDNQSYLVVRELVNKVLHHHLGTFQTTGGDILGSHGVGDVHRYDGLYALTLLCLRSCSPMRAGKSHDKQGKRA